MDHGELSIYWNYSSLHATHNVLIFTDETTSTVMEVFSTSPV